MNMKKVENIDADFGLYLIGNNFKGLINYLAIIIDFVDTFIHSQIL
jgi:hypothetical protein